MASFKTNDLAPKIAELKEAAGGADIQVSIDEASFTTVAAIQMISNGFFDRLIDDMKNICNDDVGKEAVRDGIKAIQLAHKDDPGFALDLAGGTMTLRAKMDGSLGEDLPGYGTYKELMLKKL
ncbi:hypothetical protein [Corallococcus aberystwythensis]|uniref:Uncharacterized protein n=1 Tax=Corallococcus aberystwythensis TaxID=2316722 RepID=A0A3A8P2A9_9BACT|nr:hypothetical protein [Corallococcus aberystwythensis]RKH50598.1 hypothetical protein D7W81_41035 [Corallococcus aberystwythensis]